MLTKTLALTQRGLRRDTRLLTQHLLRIGMLCVAALAVFGAHISSMTVGAPGLGFFTWIIWTTLIFSTAAGGLFFATTITEEKEEQTLGLLTLANIRPLALIVGKFAPRLVSALLILTLVLPFTLLAITLGGVTWNQVWAAYWTLAAHITFMGSIGLFFSVVCRRSGAAIAWSILAMLGYFTIPPIVASVVPVGIRTSGTVPAQLIGAAVSNLYEASAFVRVYEILQTGFDQGAFGTQVVGNFGLSALLLLTSWALFGFFNRDGDTTAQTLPLLDRKLRLRRGSRRSWSRALIWKDFHYLAGGWEWLLIRMLGYPLLAVVATVATYRSDFVQELGEMLVRFMLYALPFETVLLAARLFRAEIKEQTWATLVGLPRSIPGLALEKFGGGALGLVPAALWAVVGLALMPDKVLETAASGGIFPLAMGFLSAAGYVLLFAHLTTLYSIIFNAWAGVLLAIVTMWIGGCLATPLFLLPVMFLSAASASTTEWLGMAIGLAVFSVGFIGICFGLEVLIVQQLRSAAAK